MSQRWWYSRRRRLDSEAGRKPRWSEGEVLPKIIVVE